METLISHKNHTVENENSGHRQRTPYQESHGEND